MDFDHYILIKLTVELRPLKNTCWVRLKYQVDSGFIGHLIVDTSTPTRQVRGSGVRLICNIKVFKDVIPINSDCFKCFNTFSLVSDVFGSPKRIS